MTSLLLSHVLLFTACGDPELPRPTGPEPVGTRLFAFEDPARPMPLGPDGALAPRPVTGQLWYPTRATEGAAAPYLIPSGLLELLIDQGYYGQSVETLTAWQGLDTHALLGADPRPGRPLDLVLLSHGLGCARASTTALAVELASHGYLVAAVDHPGGGIALLEDGWPLVADDPEVEAHWQADALEWARDDVLVLDRLPLEVAREGLALGRIAALGHSMGGAAALAAACLDGRIAACIDLDGTPLTSTEQEGLCAPSLFVKAIPVRSGDRDPGPEDPEETGFGPELIASWRALARNGRAAGLYVGFRAAAHLTFSDAPFVMPDTITRFGGRVLAPERAHRLVCELVLAFLGQHLRGESPAALAALAAEPELGLFALDAAPEVVPK